MSMIIITENHSYDAWQLNLKFKTSNINQGIR